MKKDTCGGKMRELGLGLLLCGFLLISWSLTTSHPFLDPRFIIGFFLAVVGKILHHGGVQKKAEGRLDDKLQERLAQNPLPEFKAPEPKK